MYKHPLVGQMRFPPLLMIVTQLTQNFGEHERGDVSSCPLKRLSVGILPVVCQFSLVGETRAKLLIWRSLADIRPQRHRLRVYK